MNTRPGVVKTATLCLLSASLMFGPTLSIAQTSAPGQPYVDCANLDKDMAELQRRIDDLQKPIDRQQRIVDSAKKGGADAWAETDRIMREAPAKMIGSFAEKYLGTMKTLKKKIQFMKNSGVEPEKIRSWLKTMDKLDKAGEFLDAAPKGMKAGYAWGTQHQGQLGSLSDELGSALKMFNDSGLTKAAGGDLLKTLGGPFTSLALDAGEIAIDVVVSTEEAFIEQDVADQAQRSLNIIKDQQGRYDSEKYRLTKLGGEVCKSQEPQESTETAAAEPAATEPAAAAAAKPTAPVARRGMSKTTKLIVLGGVAVAGAGAIAIGLSGISTGPSGVGSNCPGRFCPASTVIITCPCPAGTVQSGGEVGCAPGQSTGCKQCVCV